MSIKEDKFGITVTLKVVPKSAQNKICEINDTHIKIKIKAPPTDGKANKELINYLSKIIKIPKKKINILKGETRKEKILSIEGISKEQFVNRLREVMK